MTGGEERPAKGRPVLSDRTVAEIIACDKTVPGKIADVGDRRAFRADNGQYRRTIDLICPEYALRMSIRQLAADAMDFSVILFYTDPDGYVYIIKRYNGNHGMHRNPHTGETFSGPHIHTISEWCQIHTNKAEGQAFPTDSYSNLQDAIAVFMKDLNISYERAIGVSRMEDFRWT